MSLRYRRTLRRRILTWSGVLLTLGMIVAGLAFTVALDRILYRTALDGAQAMADQIAASIAEDGLGPGAVETDAHTQRSRVQVLDGEHRVAFDSRVCGATVPVTDLAPGPGIVENGEETEIPGAGEESYAITARGVADPMGTAYVVVVASPLGVESRTVRIATIMLAIGSAILVTGLLLLIGRIIGHALEPVEQIRSEVARIRHVGANERVGVPSSQDEIARLAETMNDLLDRLERADSAMRRFISDASHELRSPLATVRAVIETSSGSSDHRARDAVLLGEIDRMQRLVDDLLTLAKADDNGLVIASDEVDLDDLVDQEVRRLRASATVPVTASIEPARVIGDTGRLAQVLRNLVDNAVRHTTGGVHLAVATRGEHAVVTVDNDGPPIDEDAREAVFDRFTRLQTSRERDSGGSGLGLAIVKTLVTAHGGDVVATISPQGTCRFEVRIPTS